MATIDNIKYVESLITEEINWNAHFVSHSKKHWDAMLRFSFSLCNDKIKAEDIQQTALLKSLKAFQKFVLNYNSVLNTNKEIDTLFQNNEVQYHFKNWLYRIVKNTYIDEREISKKWKLEPFNEQTFDSLHTEQNDSLQFNSLKNITNLKKEEQEFYRFALDDKWKKRFSLLNDRQRSIIFLAADDYSYKEISSILGIPIGTVMSTLSRTLQKLKSNDSTLE